MTVNRRTMMSVAGAGIALAAAQGGKGIAAAPKRPRTFVLVHGGGHGGWCWTRVAEPLRDAGHRVFAPSLTGMADRSHLLNPGIDLDTQIADVVNLLKWEDLTDVILVGHSYGGMVITGTADRALERIGHMVYLDAAHPRNGTALWGGAMPVVAEGNDAPAAANTGGAAVRMIQKVNGVDLILFPNEEFIKGPLGVTDPKDIAWMMTKLTPHPAKCFFQPLRLQNEAAVHKLPTTDIWRSSILANHRKTGLEKQTWAQQLWEIDSPSHNLMITEPKKTTDMLLRIASA